MTLRYGVIGAGVIAPLHLAGIAALDDVELTGISALDPEHVAPLADGAGCPWFVDHRELLALSPDVVVVCTPHPSHARLTIEALEAGAHVPTVTPPILRKMVWNPRTIETIAEFNDAWRKRPVKKTK